jgi:hypothetical protein
LEFVPDPVGLRPRSTVGKSGLGSLLSRTGGLVSAWGEGESPPAELEYLGGGKVRRASAPLGGKAHNVSTDFQLEQHSEVEGPRPFGDCFG